MWAELAGQQLSKRMKELIDMPAGKEKEAAIKAFYEQANKIQDSYYNDIYNSLLNEKSYYLNANNVKSYNSVINYIKEKYM